MAARMQDVVGLTIKQVQEIISITKPPTGAFVNLLPRKSANPRVVYL
jgi:hypothetical protein